MKEETVIDGFFSAPMVGDASDEISGDGIEVQSPWIDSRDLLQALTQNKKSRPGRTERARPLHNGARHRHAI